MTDIDPTSYTCPVCDKPFVDMDEFDAAHWMHDEGCPRYRLGELTDVEMEPICDCDAPYTHPDCCTECRPEPEPTGPPERCSLCGEPIGPEASRAMVHPGDCSYSSGDIERGDYCGCIPEVAHQGCAKDALTVRPKPWFNQVNFGIREDHFYPDPQELRDIPGLYETEDVPADKKIIWLHYVLGACEWWIAEVDPDEMRAFGYACLGDPQSAEWGYVSLPELEQLSIKNDFWVSVVERDFHWKEQRADKCNLPGLT